MSHRVLNPEQFYYHGTVAHLPEEVTPGRKPIFPSDTEHGYVYATPHKSSAWNYAEKAWHATDYGHPRVYKVSATGPMEVDPRRNVHEQLRSNYEGDVRSRHPLKVVSEEEMPEHMGRPEDWR